MTHYNNFYHATGEAEGSLSDNGSLALQLAAQGWWVFPCREVAGEPRQNKQGKLITPKPKSPYYDRQDLPHGKENSTTQPDLIRTWWTRWPNAFIGIYCKKSGLFAVDLDVKNGVDGFETWQELVRTHGQGVEPAYGPKQSTPSGGGHILFRLPEAMNIPNNASVIGAGIDLRSNGYICTGGVYQWIEGHRWDTELPEPPDWLIQLAQQKRQSTPNRPQKRNSDGRAWLEQALGKANVGNRNIQGHWLACQLRDNGISRETARSLMIQYALNVPGEDYSEDEALASLDSAYSTPPREPAKQQGVSQDASEMRPTSSQFPLDRMRRALNDAEFGDACLLAEMYPDSIRFDHTAGEWYIWHEGHWEADTTGAMTRTIPMRLANKYSIAALTALNDDLLKLAKDFSKRASALKNKKRIDNVINLAKSAYPLYLTGSEWDRDPLLLGTKTGLVDLRTGEFRENRPADYVRTYCPTAWIGLDAPATAWERFLLDIFSDDLVMVSFIQRLLGYGISGQNTERILPILWGKGANGKTTLLEAIGTVLGGKLTMSTQADVLMDVQKSNGGPQPFVYNLRGKRIVWASESNEGRRINAGLVKQLTGGDRINVRTLYQPRTTEFTPTHLLLLLTNHKPHIPADDQAVWDRILLIPFVNRFVDNPTQANDRPRNPKLRKELQEEASGILAWLVRGYLAWQQEGLNPPACVKAATEVYREGEDTIGHFIDEVCVITPQARVTGSALYAAYAEWCQENNISPMTGTKFGEHMTQIRGYEKRRVENCNTYFGIGLVHSK